MDIEFYYDKFLTHENTVTTSIRIQNDVGLDVEKSFTVIVVNCGLGNVQNNIMYFINNGAEESYSFIENTELTSVCQLQIMLP